MSDHTLSNHAPDPAPAWLSKVNDPRAFWQADLYSCTEDDETISASCPEDAVEDWLSQQDPDWEPEGKTVTVWAFARMEVPEHEPDADLLLESVLERLDEDYGDTRDATRPTPEMQEAAAEFARKIRAVYRVWRCDGVASAVVDLAAYNQAMRDADL